MATTMPMTTNTTIATCVQIHTGDMREGYLQAPSQPALGAKIAGMVWTMRVRLARKASVFVFAFTALAWILASGSQAHPSARATAAPSAPAGGVNVLNVGPLPLRQADYAIAQAHLLHAAIVRTELAWSLLEPRRAGEYSAASLAFLDRLVSDAAADGIKVVLAVDSSPCWATSAPANLLRACRAGQIQKANGWPPQNPQAYAAFVAFLAERYGTSLAAIEVWNEPDQANELYFAGPDKAARYAAILKAAYSEIKRVNPQVPVLAGSIVGTNGAFLRLLYANGIKGYYDGLSVHFYTLTLAALRYIHEVQVANGDHQPLWLNEFGWSSCWPHYKVQQEQACVTTGTEAANITSVYRELAGTPYVAADLIYELQGPKQENFGMLSSSGARKPAFTALASVLSSPFGALPRPTLSLRARGRSIVASGSAPVGDYMRLEAKARGLHYSALFTLNRFNRYSITLPAALGTTAVRVRVYQFWEGPNHAAQRST
jgi:hypothetical protein